MSKRYQVGEKAVHIPKVSGLRQSIASIKCLRSGGHFWKFLEDSFDVNTTLEPKPIQIYVCQNPSCRLIGYTE